MLEVSSSLASKACRAATAAPGPCEAEAGPARVGFARGAMDYFSGESLTWRKLGPLGAGAVFGAAWWIWVDAVVCNKTPVDFVHYIPGLCATLAGAMFNVVRREDLQEYSPFDEGAGCRARTWLFLAYVIAFTSVAGAAGFLVADAAGPTSSASSWPGVAGVFQCVFVIASGLIFWMSRTAVDSSYSSYY